VLVMCGTILGAQSLYLEQEVRNDEGEGQQLAAGAGVVTRPGLVARAGDRRLFTGAASLVRIFLLPITRATLSGANRVNFREDLTTSTLLGTDKDKTLDG
jgi:hypothetical protein